MASHLNRKWSLKDVDDVQSMLRRHADARTIAEAYLTTEAELLAMCQRNGLPMPKPSRPNSQGAANAEDDSA